MLGPSKVVRWQWWSRARISGKMESKKSSNSSPGVVRLGFIIFNRLTTASSRETMKVFDYSLFQHLVHLLLHRWRNSRRNPHSSNVMLYHGHGAPSKGMKFGLQVNRDMENSKMHVMKPTSAVFLPKSTSCRRTSVKNRSEAFKEARSADPSRSQIELSFCMSSYNGNRQIFRCEPQKFW